MGIDTQREPLGCLRSMLTVLHCFATSTTTLTTSDHDVFYCHQTQVLHAVCMFFELGSFFAFTFFAQLSGYPLVSVIATTQYFRHRMRGPVNVGSRRNGPGLSIREVRSALTTLGSPDGVLRLELGCPNGKRPKLKAGAGVASYQSANGARAGAC